MTLKSIISLLQQIAYKTPNVRMVITNDFYRINELPNVEYACVGIQQTQHTVVEQNVVRYGLQLIYADRLTADKNNEIDAQSDGMLVLGSIINTFTSYYDADLYGDITYETFLQRFADECAVVVASFTLETRYTIGECYEINQSKSDSI